MQPDSKLTVELTLTEGVRLLTQDTAHLDAVILLEHATSQSREWLLSHGRTEMDDAELAHYRQLIRRRASGWPVAYLVGRKEFYGREFLVNQDVLIPRPETEVLVEEAIRLTEPGDTVVDVGTGSGCIAVTVAAEGVALSVIGVDISRAALDVAKANARKHEQEVVWIEADAWPDQLPADPAKTIVIANLPYVTDAVYTVSGSIKHEPELAFRGGSDGLDVIRKLQDKLRSQRFYPKALLLELDPSQVAVVRRGAWGTTRILSDLAGRQRVAVIEDGPSVRPDGL